MDLAAPTCVVKGSAEFRCPLLQRYLGIFFSSNTCAQDLSYVVNTGILLKR